MVVSDRLVAFSESLKLRIETMLRESSYGSFINDKSIRIVIGKKGLKLRVIEPLPKVATKSKRSPQQIEQLKTVRKTFKDNLDVMNILVLLVRLNDELDKFAIEKLDDAKKTIAQGMVADINKKFQKLLK